MAHENRTAEQKWKINIGKTNFVIANEQIKRQLYIYVGGNLVTLLL